MQNEFGREAAKCLAELFSSRWLAMSMNNATHRQIADQFLSWDRHCLNLLYRQWRRDPGTMINAWTAQFVRKAR